MRWHSRESGVMVADETDKAECITTGTRYCTRLTVHFMECPECGRSYEHVYGDYEFCPRCGCRFIEEEDDGK